MGLYKLMYVSDRIKHTDDIENIEKNSSSFNIQNDITGSLLYTDNNYIQIIEGDNLLLTNLFFKIQSDERHENVRLINFEEIISRNFYYWHTLLINGQSLGKRIEFKHGIKTGFDDILKNEYVSYKLIEVVVYELAKKHELKTKLL